MEPSFQKVQHAGLARDWTRLAQAGGAGVVPGAHPCRSHEVAGLAEPRPRLVSGQAVPTIQRFWTGKHGQRPSTATQRPPPWAWVNCRHSASAASTCATSWWLVFRMSHGVQRVRSREGPLASSTCETPSSAPHCGFPTRRGCPFGWSVGRCSSRWCEAARGRLPGNVPNLPRCAARRPRRQGWSLWAPSRPQASGTSNAIARATPQTFEVQGAVDRSHHGAVVLPAHAHKLGGRRGSGHASRTSSKSR